MSEIREKRGRNQTLLINEGSKFIKVAGVSQPKWWGYLWQSNNDGYQAQDVFSVTQIIDYDVIILTQDDMGNLFDVNATKETPTENFLKNIPPKIKILTGNSTLNVFQ